MSAAAGLWLLLALLVLAWIVAGVLRVRALDRRRWAAELAADEEFLEAIRRQTHPLRPVWCGGSALEALGLPVFTSERLPEGIDALVCSFPPVPPPVVTWEAQAGDIMADLRRAQALVREYGRMELLVARPSAVKIVSAL